MAVFAAPVLTLRAVSATTSVAEEAADRTDVARVRAIPGSDALKRLVAEFDRAWGDKVTRSRDIVQVIQAIASAN